MKVHELQHIIDQIKTYTVINVQTSLNVLCLLDMPFVPLLLAPLPICHEHMWSMRRVGVTSALHFMFLSSRFPLSLNDTPNFPLSANIN